MIKKVILKHEDDIVWLMMDGRDIQSVAERIEMLARIFEKEEKNYGTTPIHLQRNDREESNTEAIK